MVVLSETMSRRSFRHLLPVLIAILFLVPQALLGAPRRVPPSHPKVKKTERYAPDHLIVKYKKGAGAADRQANQARVRATPMRTFKSSGAVLLKLPPGLDVDKAIEQIRADPSVEYARRDHYLQIHQTFPNDPDFESCWGLHNTNQYLLGKEDADIDAPEAWDITTGSSDVIVAVIDTGVEYTHEDLAANMWVNEAERDGTADFDDDGNGYVDDVYGIRVINGVVGSDPYDDHGHGTHCAGILGAVGNNATGVTGVNWTVRIMGLKFLNSGGWGLESDAAVCLEYAVDNGATITSNSYGGPDDVQALYDAITYANDNGVLFCTSAGNDGMDNDTFPSYPACYDQPNIISVAATGYGDNIAWFSNYGATSVHVGAPGEVITSTWLGDTYADLDGTSMACPFVAGIAALVKANEPGIGLAALRSRVMWTGDWTFDLQETTLTGLRVNAYNALMGIYAVRIVTQSPLPDATEGVPYSYTMEAQGFAPPYTWAWSGSQYVERETPNGFTFSGAAQGWQAEEGMWRLDLPFSFPFYGSNYDHLYVCSNGYLEFAATPPLPDNNAETGLFRLKKIIAPYWSDLTTNSAYIATDIYVWQPDADSIGVRWAASELEWLMVMPINVSVVLHSDGQIEMHYGPENNSWVGGVVGISNGDGANYRLSPYKTGKLAFGWAPTSHWGPGSIPPGLNLNADTGMISGTPTTAGSYTFDVTVGDTSGGSDTRQFDLKVFDPDGPRADFTGTPLQGVETVTVQFTDTSTSATGITAWLWNFGDGTTSGDQNPSHVYTGVGNYSVNLTVTDASGSDTMTKLQYIKVYSAGPIADFTATPLVGDAPLTVTFSDQSQPQSPEIEHMLWIWEWDFGDGQTATLYTPTPFDHVYEDDGLYTVTLTVFDLLMNAGVKTKVDYIVVGAVRDRTLTWSVSPAGGTITVTPPGVTSASGSHVYDHGSVVDLTANPDPGHHFDHWDGDVDDPYALATSIYMDNDKAVVAHFGDGAPGEIHGGKWSDADGDSVRDGDESGLQAWRIFLDEDGDAVWDANERYRLTAADGSYSFTNMPPGTYSVVEEPQNGWQRTFPQPPAIGHAVVLDPGELEENVNFGNQFVGVPPPAPTNPSPPDGAADVPVDTNLSWEAGSAGYDYQEDFSDGLAQGWFERVDANWQVVAGEYRAAAGIGIRMQAIYMGQTWDDCTAQMTVRRTGETAPASSLALRASDDFVWLGAGNAYLVAIDGGQEYYVGKQVGGTATSLQYWTSSSNLNAGSGVNIVKVTVEGTSIKVYFNGNLTWSGSSSAVPDAGRITLNGLSGIGSETVHYFDDVMVGPPSVGGSSISALQQWYNAHPVGGGSPDIGPLGAEVLLHPAAQSVSPAAVHADADSATYDVYFDAVSPPITPIGTDLTGTTCDPTPGGGALSGETTYYWQVVAKNPAGQTPGPVWSFTTAASGPTLGVSVTPSTFDFGIVAPGTTHTNDGAPLTVQNTGEAAEDIGIRIRIEDDRGEWTVGTPATNVYELSSRLAAAVGTFTAEDVLTTAVQWCDGIKFGGGGNDMAAAATINQWFEFKAPTAVAGAHAAGQHTMTVEVSCRLAE